MADSKITALTAISTVDPTADPLVIVDVSDTSMAASGTTKKSTINQLLGAGGTATLASATITGDLTVDTSTLKVDSANNAVGVGTASPTANTLTIGANRFIICSDSQSKFGDNGLINGAAADGNTQIQFFGSKSLFFNEGVATRMTLNATGLGVGTSPTGYGILALKKDNTSAPPYIVLDNRGTGGTDTNTYTQGGILFGAFRDVSNPAYIASITVERKSAAGGASSTGDLIFGTASTPTNGVATERLRIDSSGNVIVNTAAVATTATDGFLYIPGCAGTPTGTPTAKTGRVPLVVDTANNKLYFYSGGAWVAAN